MIVKCNHSVLECPKLWTDKGIWKIPCCQDWKEIIWRRKLWKVHWKSSNARTKSSRFLQYQSHFWCMWRRWDGDLWSTHIRKYAHKNNLNRIFGIDRLYWISTFEVAQGDSLAIVGWLVKCYYCVQQGTLIYLLDLWGVTEEVTGGLVNCWLSSGLSPCLEGQWQETSQPASSLNLPLRS
jgi:hypothetical protein